MSESYSVEAILSAVDKNFSSTFEDMADVANNATQAINGGLSTLSKYSAIAGTAVTAMGVKSLKSFGDFQASLNKAAIVAGGTSKNIKELGDVANKMGADLPLSAQDAADAMVQMAQDGASIDTIKEEFPAIARAATAAGADLQSTAGTVQIAMNIWGKSIGSSAQAAAILTETANISNASIEEMQQAFADVGSIASQVGFNMQDTATAIGMVTNSGLPAAQAAQDLNFALTKMIRPSKAASEMADSLGISYYTAQGKMKSLPTILQEVASKTSGLNDQEKQLALTTMFGTAGFKAMGPLLKSVTNNTNEANASWNAASKAIYGVSSSAKQANKVLNQQATDMQNNIGSSIEQVGGNWEQLRNTAEQTYESTNSSILGMINDVIGMASRTDTAFGQMSQGFIGLSTVIGPAMTGFAGFAAQMNAVNNFLGISGVKTGVFSKQLSSLSKSGNYVKAIKDELSGLGKTLSGNSISLGGLKSKFESGFGSIKNSALTFTGDIGKTLTNLNLGAYADTFNFQNKFANTFDVVAQKASSFSTALGKPLASAKQSMSNFAENVPAIAKPISGTFSLLGKTISGGMKTSMNIGTSVLQNGLNMIGTVMSTGLKAVGPAAVIGLLVAGLGAANGKFGEQIQAMITTATTKGPEVITNFVAGIVASLPALMDSGKNLVTSLLNAITINLPAIITGAVAIVTTLATNLTSGANGGSMLTAAVNMIMALVSGIVTALPQLMSAGISVLMALIDAIVVNLPMLITAAMQMIQTLADGLMQNMDQIINGALAIVDELVTGISQNLPKLIETALKIIISIVTGLIDNIDRLIDAALQIITALAQALIDNLDLIINAAIKLALALMNGLINNIDKIIDAGVKLTVALVGALIQNAPKLIKGAIQLITALVNGLIRNLPKLVAAGAHLVAGLAKEIWRHKGDLLDAGGQLIMGLVKGIGNAVGSAVKAAAEVAGKIVGGVKKALGIHSPSRVMAREVGQYIPAGVAVGIMNSMKPITSAVDAMQSAAMMTLPSVNTSPFNASLRSLNNRMQATNLSPDLNINSQTQQTIEVPLYINGREFARATSGDIQSALNQRQTNNNRMLGIRGV